MNVEIKLVGELKDATMQTVLNVLADHTGCAPKAAAPKAVAKVKAETAEDSEETETSPKASAAPAPKSGAAKGPAPKGPAPKAAPKGPAPKAAPAEEIDFDGMEEEDQLAEIVRLSTTFTKKGRSADIRTLVGIFDANRASELDPAVYGEYYSLLNRMKAGESAEDLAAENAV